jgi:hypothetical protein
LRRPKRPNRFAMALMQLPAKINPGSTRKAGGDFNMGEIVHVDLTAKPRLGCGRKEEHKNLL